MALIALCDACVLYPAPLRDLLMRLAMEGLYQPRWTQQIHDEWTRNVLANRPDLKPQQLHRTRELMDRAVPEALVSGYQHLIPKLSLPDADDRHVLAAAIHCNADIILTFNLADFPLKSLKAHDVQAIAPDDFISRQLQIAPQSVCSALRKQRAALQNPPQSVDEFLSTLSRQSLEVTVAKLESLREML